MIKNYIKIAWRNLIRNKFSSLINIVGLAVGMAVAILIGLWIWDELSYNKYYKNYNRIVMVMQHQTLNGNVLTQTSVPMPLGYTLKKDYQSDFKYVVLITPNNEHILSYGDKKLTQLGSYMQPEAPELFTLNMLRGNRQGLTDQSSIMLSDRTAKAIFGNANPMGKVLKIDNKWVVKVTGVYEDMPKNTTFNDVAFIAPWDLYLTTAPWLKTAQTKWGNNSWAVLCVLNPNADIDKVSTKIKDIKLKNLQSINDKVGASFKSALFLYPISRWHLFFEFKNGVNTGGAIQFVWMFAIVGVFVLLLACINFMNMSTAKSEKRAKEVGIRKTVGSLRGQLIWQFFSESLLVTVFGLILSLVLVQVTLPWFNQVADKETSILWGSPVFWLLCIGFSLVTGLIAGSYPALYLSSFNPVKVLKGTFKVGRFAALPRKVLVVLQFTVSIALIIGTIIVFRQVQYTKNRPVGYNRNGLVQIKMKTPVIHDHFMAVRNDLLQTGAISELAESGSPLTNVWSNYSGFEWRGKDPNTQDDFAWIPISPEFGKASGWKIKEGRNFSRVMLTDSAAIILNESAVNFMGLKHPVGEIVTSGKDALHVVGVIKDMVMASPYEPVKPTIFALVTQPEGVMNIRVNPNVSIHEALEKAAAVFKKYDPDSPFDYSFTDNEYAKKFGDEERIGTLSAFFTALAIFISCMGLFGMASFMAEQRTKEIGVRKVLGASVFNLWRLLSKDFVILVIISLLIATPIAYYFMHGWLQNYKYRAEMSWWIFAVTGVGAIIITLCTVSFQSIKAALANPVKSLRSE
ncbi:FtsX-like permease family protein [Mucilaginibacter gracilis]|uniref:FtsX-like permease family protein n=1 Tax=Mucilaginibacter gracilis TaxID=423350 RepID=A0A495JB60_9SPHI|nr:ABC transporter permease [Mucilaginibacter gracilis]RKR85728.1 FtsX-like permease family protein [Mucilaginibacter gracilis]